jgi:hypothetical protein
MTQTIEPEATGTRLVGQPRRRGLWIAIVLIAIAALALAAWWYFNRGPGQASPAGSVVLEANGDGNQATDSFNVRPGWRIDWENQGDQFSFAIRGDRDFGTVVEQQEPGSGITSPTGGGNYSIEVTSNGPWSLTVFQGD